MRTEQGLQVGVVQSRHQRRFFDERVQVQLASDGRPASHSHRTQTPSQRGGHDGDRSPSSR